MALHDRWVYQQGMVWTTDLHDLEAAPKVSIPAECGLPYEGKNGGVPPGRTR